MNPLEKKERIQTDFDAVVSPYNGKRFFRILARHLLNCADFARNALFVFLIFFSMSACHPRHIPETRLVNHVVLLWFDSQISEEDLDKINTQAKLLKNIPGVRALQVGSAIASKRKIVDDSFHLGLLFQFDSTEAMTHYLNNPAHKKFVNQYIKKKVLKIVVYDF